MSSLPPGSETAGAPPPLLPSTLLERLAARLRQSRLLRAASLLLLANVIVTLLALVRTPAITWLLPKEDVGRIAVVSAWTAFIVLLSLPGLDSASYHYIAKRQAWALPVVLRARAPFTLLASLGFVAGAAWWWTQGDRVLVAFFVAMALGSPLLYTFSVAGGTLAAQERFGALFWFRIGESLVDFAGFIPLLVGAWWISKGFTFYALNQLALAVLLWLVVRASLRRMEPAEKEPPSPGAVHELVVYGRHLSVLTALSVAQAQVDLLLVGTFLPLTVAAEYSIASIVGNQMRVLWSIYLSVRYPVFVRFATSRRSRRMRLEGGLVVAGFALVGVVAFYAAALLIRLLLPESYAAAIPYIPWLFAAMVASLPGAVIETYFRTEQDERRQYYLRAAALVPSVLLPALLLSRWGVDGVLWGRLLAGFAFSLIALAVALWVRPARHEPAA